MQLLAFLLFPALELYLLFRVGAAIGAFNMMLWVFLSAVMGIWAVRTQGQGALNRVRTDMAEGRVPQNPFLEGLLLFLGGVFLIVPGLITDAVGIVLLVPPFRRLIASWLRQFIMQHPGVGAGASRVTFFHFGGPMNSGGAAGYRSDYDASEQDFPGRRAHGAFGYEDDSPRQATVIESTAIDISASRTDTGASPGNGPSEANPGNGPSDASPDTEDGKGEAKP